MRSTLLFLICVVGPAASTAAVAQEGEIQVGVNRLYESRHIQVIKEKNTNRNTLGIVLRFSGPSIENATRLGKLQIDSIKDDKGNSLRSSYSVTVPSNRLTLLRRARAFGSKPAPPRSRHDLSISMSGPARGATKLSELNGKITFRVAKTKSVLIPLTRLNDLSGKTLKNAELDKLGLVVEVDKYSGKGNPSLKLKVSGKSRDTFLEARFVDAKGKIVDTTSFSYSTAQAIKVTTSSFKKIPADSQLKIVVETEFKDVPVKIALKDIPLP